MITVILTLQPAHHLLHSDALLSGQRPYRLRKVMLQFLLRDAAQCLVARIHAEVSRLVKSAEHTVLRELRHPRQQHEPEVFVRRLEHRIESLQQLTVAVLQRPLLTVHPDHNALIQHIQYRLVILVYQHHATTASTKMGLAEDVCKTATQVCIGRDFPIHPLPFCHIILQPSFQCLFLHEHRPVEVHVKHRIFRPFLLQFLQGKPLEQVLPSLEISLQRGHQQALAKTAGTAEEINLPLRHQLMQQRGLVHIHKTVFTKLCKTLYTYRIFYHTITIKRCTCLHKDKK